MEITRKKILASGQNHKFAYLLASFGVLLLLFPFLEDANIGRHVFSILLALILITSIIAISDSKTKLFVALAIAVPTIGLNLTTYFDPNPIWFAANQIFACAFFIFTALVLFVHILHKERVTHDEVFGAISVYLLIAMAFASLFLIADRVEPGSFVKSLSTTPGQGMTYSDYVYYSFGSITTAGAGGIIEIGSFVRALTMAESVIGLFYVAFVISKLVSPLKT